MISESDLHVVFVRQPLPAGAAGQTIGMLQVAYEVTRFTDVRSLSTRRGYRIAVRQRVILPNDGASLMGAAKVVAYGYTPLLTVNTDINPGDTASDYYLVEFSPRTLNASVSTSATGSASTDASVTSSQTSGSSSTTVNTYQFGLIPSDSTKSETRFDSSTASKMTGRSASRSMSDSMSVKDWSSYASVDRDNRNIGWIWAQTFPWDVITHHYTDAAGVVTLPDSVRALLFPPSSSDGVILVNPPSQLALFGLDFASHAEWLYLVDDTAPRDQVTFTHIVAPHAGWHGVDDQYPSPTVVLRQDPTAQLTFVSPQLDLALLALDPIPTGVAETSALIGFVSSQFITKPSSPKGFAIISSANTLLVRGAPGAGFQDPLTNDAPMTVELAAGAQASFEISFKVADEDHDYSLFLKHWKLGVTGVWMTLAINGGAPITRHIDTSEAGGGSDNVTRIFLRRRSFNSDEYFDYLVPGLNIIEVTLSPADPGPDAPVVDCGYAIRALAIN